MAFSIINDLNHDGRKFISQVIDPERTKAPPLLTRGQCPLWSVVYLNAFNALYSKVGRLASEEVVRR